MPLKRLYTFLTTTIAGIWLINGLFCKVLHLVPRHTEIVARILGPAYARPLTVLIGWSEIAMAVWVLLEKKPRLTAVLQILIIAVMNILEAMLAPDLLLWGPSNAFFAAFLIAVIYFNTFILRKKVCLEMLQ